MSRSYRHNPIVKDRNRNNQHKVKRWASKAARNCHILTNGNMYRKVFDSWRISDYWFSLWGWMKHDKRYITVEDVRMFWNK
jgi:hypothetical protein